MGSPQQIQIYRCRVPAWNNKWSNIEVPFAASLEIAIRAYATQLENDDRGYIAKGCPDVEIKGRGTFSVQGSWEPRFEVKRAKLKTMAPSMPSYRVRKLP